MVCLPLVFYHHYHSGFSYCNGTIIHNRLYGLHVWCIHHSAMLHVYTLDGLVHSSSNLKNIMRQTPYIKMSYLYPS